MFTCPRRPREALDHLDQSLLILRRIGDLNNAATALKIERGPNSNSEVRNREETSKSLSLIETVRAQTGSQQHRASYLASEREHTSFMSIC